MDYVSREGAVPAARELLGGFDAVLSWGGVSERDVLDLGRPWEALAPEEHVIGARAAAIVVHARNPLDTLSREQLEFVFSGEVENWRAVGGEQLPIRRYGLASSSPLTKSFERAFPAAGSDGIIRRPTSADILRAISTDPGGVGFVDASSVVTAGGAVKALGVGGVTADVQSVKDGRYPFADVLVLYVSPDASEGAKGFVQFVLSGEGDGVFRRHALLPTLRRVRSDAIAGFYRLYGPEIERVRATPDPGDDLDLAMRILKSAQRLPPDDVQLLAAMCAAAYELSENIPGGETAVFEVLNLLSERIPGRRLDSAEKRVALYERAYRADRSMHVGSALIDALQAHAAAATSGRLYAEAAVILERAKEVAEQIGSPDLARVRERHSIAAARVRAERDAWVLAEWLLYDPNDRASRARLILLHLLEFDAPSEALRHVDADSDAELKANLPLAAQPVSAISKDSALTLAEWYTDLAAPAAGGRREVAAARARAYYRRFFELHGSRRDSLARRARVGLEKIGEMSPDLGAAGADGQRLVRSGREVFDLRLAELVASNTDLTQLTSEQIGSARRLEDVRPLTRLSRLSELELAELSGVRDLSPIGRLSGLTSLTLTHLRVNDLDALSGLSQLRALDLSDARNLSDLGPLSRLTQLRTLILTNCVNVADLSPIVELPHLTRLTLSGCVRLRDLSPLEKLSGQLTTLDLSGCSGIEDVYPLSKCKALKTLDLRGCDRIPEADIDWLREQLPGCAILSGPAQP